MNARPHVVHLCIVADTHHDWTSFLHCALHAATVVVRGIRTREGRLKMDEKNQMAAQVGFEPPTLRSCGQHSIHYTPDTRRLTSEGSDKESRRFVRPDETPTGLINNAKSHHQMSPLYRSGHAHHYNRRFPHGPPRTLRRPSPIFTVHLALFADHHPYPQYTSQTFTNPPRILSQCER